MKIDFSKINVEINFAGDRKDIDVRKPLANYGKVKTSDIGFEDFCREIYYSEGEIEVGPEQARQLRGLLTSPDCPIIAIVKRGILEALSNS